MSFVEWVRLLVRLVVEYSIAILPIVVAVGYMLWTKDTASSYSFLN